MKFITIILVLIFFSCNSNSKEWDDSKAICKCLENNEKEIINSSNKYSKDSILLDCYLRILVLKEYYLKIELDSQILVNLENDSCKIYSEFYKDGIDKSE